MATKSDPDKVLKVWLVTTIAVLLTYLAAMFLVPGVAMFLAIMGAIASIVTVFLANRVTERDKRRLLEVTTPPFSKEDFEFAALRQQALDELDGIDIATGVIEAPVKELPQTDPVRGRVPPFKVTPAPQYVGGPIATPEQVASYREATMRGLDAMQARKKADPIILPEGAEYQPLHSCRSIDDEIATESDFKSNQLTNDHAQIRAIVDDIIAQSDSKPDKLIPFKELEKIAERNLAKLVDLRRELITQGDRIKAIKAEHKACAHDYEMLVLGRLYSTGLITPSDYKKIKRRYVIRDGQPTSLTLSDIDDKIRKMVINTAADISRAVARGEAACPICNGDRSLHEYPKGLESGPTGRVLSSPKGQPGEDRTDPKVHEFSNTPWDY